MDYSPLGRQDVWREAGQGGVKQGQMVLPVIEAATDMAVWLYRCGTEIESSARQSAFLDGTGVCPAAARLAELVGDSAAAPVSTSQRTRRGSDKVALSAT